jgi:hypothetical protein
MKGKLFQAKGRITLISGTCTAHHTSAQVSTTRKTCKHKMTVWVLQAMHDKLRVSGLLAQLA